MIILGIDVGVHGAIAVMRDGALADVIDMPVVKKTGKRAAVDRYALARIIDALGKEHITHAFIEEVWSTPRDGSVGSFMFGRAYEAACMVVAAHFIPTTEVTPVKWRNAMGVRKAQKKGDKTPSVQRANELFPKHSHLWVAKCHADRAEAALIAEHGRRVLSGATL